MPDVPTVRLVEMLLTADKISVEYGNISQQSATGQANSTIQI